MKIIRFLSLVFLVTIISLFSGFVLSYSAQERELNILYPTPEITLENFKELPQMLNDNNDRKPYGFADVAWKTFVTLNWPANDGKPLEANALGKAPLAPRVWEFYRTPEEVFLPNDENPLNISKPFARTLKLDLIKGRGAGSPEEESNLENIKLQLQRSRNWIKKVIESNKCPDQISVGTEEQNLLLTKIPLVDQKGNYIIVETHLNPNEVNQIVKGKWYNANTLALYDDEKKKFKFESTLSTGAPLEIKAAWRVFDDKSLPEEKNRYYTAKRVLAIPATQYVCTTDNCRTDHPVLETDPPVLEEVEVGLIGFHIAYKIPQQKLLPSPSSTIPASPIPGWVWATFEQVDNLKVDNGPQKLQPTLSNPDCDPKNPNKGKCLSNYPYIEWPFLWRDKAPHAVTRTTDPNAKDAKEQIKNQIPTQVVRLSEQPYCKDSNLSSRTKESLKQQNKNWQEAFKKVKPDSVWQYYQLVGTQWLQDPGLLTETGSRAHLMSEMRKELRPGALFNVSMEAYSQTQVNGDSCIGCHVAATLPSSRENSKKVVMSDFSFLLQRAKSSSNN